MLNSLITRYALRGMDLGLKTPALCRFPGPSPVARQALVARPRPVALVVPPTQMPFVAHWAQQAGQPTRALAHWAARADVRKLAQAAGQAVRVG